MPAAILPDASNNPLPFQDFVPTFHKRATLALPLQFSEKRIALAPATTSLRFKILS